MIASVAHFSESETSARRSGDSATNSYRLHERNAGHALRNLRFVPVWTEKTQAVDRECYVRVTRMLQEFVELPGYIFARALLHAFEQLLIASQIGTRPQENLPWLQQGPYAARLSELQDLAKDEGISPMMPKSEWEFLKFVNSRDFPVRRASLALLDGGALGATWRNEQWRLSLRFCGDGHVGYVLLDRRKPPEGATGRSDLNNFSVDCERLDLRALLQE